MHLTGRQGPVERVESVLVLRFSSMGDIILTTPVLRAMRAHWPGARIVYVTKACFAPLLKGNRTVDEIFILEEPGRREELERLAESLSVRHWDILADLHHSLRSRILRKKIPARSKVFLSKPYLNRSLLVYARLDLYGPEPAPMPWQYAAALAGLGLELDNGPCELHPDEEDLYLFRSALPPGWMEAGPFLALAPGAAWPTKRWPAERFAAAAAALCDRHGFSAVLLGGGPEAQDCELVRASLGPERCVNLAGRLPLMASAAALSRARLLISNDTGLMHMATAVGTPVAAVFGPTTRHFGYFPYRATSRVVEIPLWCRPCTHNGRQRCPLGHFRCMRDIQPERVIVAAEELLIGTTLNPGAGA
ncbi:glycosyltransferase family 9 protein [bacterium]|nr:glycosyltransferase family 9 protein [bacterium]